MSDQTLVLWDIDGTLIDADEFDQELECAALRDVFGIDSVDLSDHHGMTHAGVAVDAGVAAGMTPEDAEALLPQFSRALERIFKENYERYIQSVRVLPGVRELLRELHERGVRQTVLTGNTAACARLKLELTGLADVMDWKIGAYGDDHCNRGALGGICLERFADAYGEWLDPRTITIIGESPRDIACARVNGFRMIAVATGVYGSEELARLQPDAVVEDLRDVSGVLGALSEPTLLGPTAASFRKRGDTRGMQALILAAGAARRMRHGSNNVHKALLPVAGSTPLARMVNELLDVGVTSITVATGYASDQITEHLRTHFPDVAFTFVHNSRFAETNNIVSLSLALDHMNLDDDVVLVECDLLIDRKVLVRLVEHPADNVALVEPYRTGLDGTVVTLADGVISSVIPKTHQDRHFNYANTYKTLNIYRFSGAFAKDVLRPLMRCYANEIDPQSYYEAVFGMVCGNPDHQISAAVIDHQREPWIEVDDPNDVTIARFLFEPDRRAEVLDTARGGYWNFDVLDFGMMQNVRFPTEPMLAMISHAMPDLIGNYGSAQQVLNQKLAYVLACKTERLQVLHGATQAYPILRRLWEGKSVAVPSPTFGEYPRMFPHARTYDDTPGTGWGDLDDLASEVDVCVIVNPNNPSGTTMPTAEIMDLIRRHPTTTFLVDESFESFVNDRSLLSRLEEEPLPNVLVLASLSKALGASGLRVGYLYSPDAAVVAAVGADVPIWNLGAPAEFLLELLLKFRNSLLDSFTQTIADREQFALELSTLDTVAEVYPSGGNFLLLRLNGDDPKVASELRQRLLVESRIDIKDVTDRFADGLPRIRVAVRLPHDNAQLIEAMSGSETAYVANTSTTAFNLRQEEGSRVMYSETRKHRTERIVR